MKITGKIGSVPFEAWVNEFNGRYEWGVYPTLNIERVEVSKESADFIEAHGLVQFVDEALANLRKAFDYKKEPHLWVFTDHSDGSRMLMIDVWSSQPAEDDRRLMDFCYDWWFDRIGTMGHLIGFRISASS